MIISHNGVSVTVTHNEKIQRIMQIVFMPETKVVNSLPITNTKVKNVKRKKKIYHRWTQAEINEVKRLYTLEHLTPKLIAAKLQVTPSAIGNILYEIKHNIVRNYDTPNQVQEV